MKADITNAFTLGRYGLEPGIAVFDDAIECRTESGSVEVLLNEYVLVRRFKDKRRLTRAQPMGKSSKSRLVGNKGWQGLLLRVITNEVNFRQRPLLSAGTLWPGAEPQLIGVRSLAQVGGRKKTQQDQVVAVEAGKPVFVVDGYRGVQMIWYTGKEIRFRPADLSDAAVAVTHVMKRKQDRRCLNRPALSWGINTLRDIQQQSGAPDVSNIIDRLADLKRGIKHRAV